MQHPLGCVTSQPSKITVPQRSNSFIGILEEPSHLCGGWSSVTRLRVSLDAQLCYWNSSFKQTGLQPTCLTRLECGAGRDRTSSEAPELFVQAVPYVFHQLFWIRFCSPDKVVKLGVFSM